jgi:antitoxin HicB
MSKTHIGSTVDDFLREEEIFEEAQTQAISEVLAWQTAQANEKKLSDNRIVAQRSSRRGDKT